MRQRSRPGRALSPARRRPSFTTNPALHRSGRSFRLSGAIRQTSSATVALMLRRDAALHRAGRRTAPPRRSGSTAPRAEPVCGLNSIAPGILATCLHQVLARSLLTGGSMQKPQPMTAALPDSRRRGSLGEARRLMRDHCFPPRGGGASLRVGKPRRCYRNPDGATGSFACDFGPAAAVSNTDPPPEVRPSRYPGPGRRCRCLI
jgi:hypothetical protein